LITEAFGVSLNQFLPGISGERDEDNGACHYIADGFAGRFDRRLRHSKEAAKLL